MQRQEPSTTIQIVNIQQALQLAGGTGELCIIIQDWCKKDVDYMVHVL